MSWELRNWEADKAIELYINKKRSFAIIPDWHTPARKIGKLNALKVVRQIFN